MTETQLFETSVWRNVYVRESLVFKFYHLLVGAGKARGL